MKMNTLGWMVVAGALATSFFSCSQPKAECVAAHAGAFYGFAAKYTPVAPPACAMGITQAGDQVGFETYHPSKDTGDGPQADYDTTFVAIQTDYLFYTAAAAAEGLDKDGNPAPASDSNPDHKLYYYGQFSSVEPDASDFCQVTPAAKNAKAEQNLPAYFVEVFDDMGNPKDPPEFAEVPAANITYDWKNVNVYVTATAQGTQFAADLTITENTCAVDYKVVGVWPLVDCSGDGGEAYCCPDADPDYAALPRATGSGINPDFPVTCDPVLKVCVLDIKAGESIPVLKPDWSKDEAAHPECKVHAAAAGAGGGGM